MAIPGYTLTEIQDTDTFKEWADKCKNIQLALNSTEFITTTTGVTVDTAQTITGVKTFNASILATETVTVNSPNKSFTISGNGNFIVSKNVAFSSDFTSDGRNTLAATTSIPLTLKNGSQGTSLAVDVSGNLDVSSELTADKLTSDTSLSVTTSAFVGGDAQIVGSLTVDSDTTTINSVEYTWPSAVPNGTSFLRSDSGTFIWETEEDHTLEVIQASVAALSETNFTLPVEVVPITTVTEADTSILSQFIDNGDGTYGTSTTLLTWRVCDGSTVSFDLAPSPPDDRYRDLCLALNDALNPSDTSGSATLPDLRLVSQPFTVDDIVYIGTDTTADIGDWQTTDGIESGVWNVEASWGKNYVDSTFKSFGTLIDRNYDCDEISFYISQDNQLYASGYTHFGFGSHDNNRYKGYQPVHINFTDEDEYVVDFTIGGDYSESNYFVISNLGRIYSAGYNGAGGLGHNNFVNTYYTRRVGNLEGVKALAVGGGPLHADHALAIDGDDNLWSWGHNDQGQLGIGSFTPNKSTPQLVDPAFLNGATPVKIHTQIGYGSSYLIDSNGDLYTCGHNNYGQLGHGDVTWRNTFTKVTTISNVKKIVTHDDNGSSSTTFALLDNGDLYGCGYNGYGQLGQGDGAARSTFTQITSGFDGLAVTDFVAYSYKGSCCAIMSDGSIRTWGGNDFGNLGHGNTSVYTLPVKPASFPTNENAVKVLGHSYNYPTLGVLTESGNLYQAGYNGYGVLSQGNNLDSYNFLKALTYNQKIKDFQYYGFQSLQILVAVTEENEILTVGYNDGFATGHVNVSYNTRILTRPTAQGLGGFFGTSNTSIAKRYEIPEGEYLYFGVKQDKQYQAITTSATAPPEGDSDWVLLDDTIISSDEGVVVDEETSYIRGNATKLVNAYGQDGSTIKIIKAEKDQTTSFSVSGGDGISITSAGPNAENLGNAFDIYGAPNLKLDVNTFDFSFVNRELQIDAEEFGVLDQPYGDNQKTVVRRDSIGCTYMNDPVNGRHVTNKRWVESKIQELTDGTIQQLRDETEENFSIDRGSVRSLLGDTYSPDRKNTDPNTGYPSGYFTSFHWINRYGDPSFMGYHRWNHSTGDREFHPVGGGPYPGNGSGGTITIRFRGKEWESHDEYSSRVKEIIPLNNQMTVYVDQDDYLYAVGYDHKAYFGTGPDTVFNGYQGLSRKYPTLVLNRFGNPFQVDWISVGNHGRTENNTYHYSSVYYKEKDTDIKYGNIYCGGANNDGSLGRQNFTDLPKNNAPLQMGYPADQTAKMMWMYFSELGGDWDPSTGNNNGTDDLQTYFHNKIEDTNQYNIKIVRPSHGGAFAIVRRASNVGGHLWACGGGYKGIGDDQSRVNISNWVPVIKNSGGFELTVSGHNNGVYTTSIDHTLQEFDAVKVGSGWWRCRLGDLDGNNKDRKFRLYNDNEAGTKECILGGTAGLYKNTSFASTIFVRKKRLTSIKKFCFIGQRQNYMNVIALDTDGKIWGFGKNRAGAGTGRSGSGTDVAFLAESNPDGGFVNDNVDDIWGSTSDVSYCTKTVQVGAASRTDLFSCGQAEEGTLGQGSITVDSPLFAKLGYMTEDINHTVHKVFCLSGDKYNAGDRRGTTFVVTKPIDGTTGKAKLWAAGYNYKSRLGTPNRRGLDTNFFQDIQSPEDPLKLVELEQNVHQTFILFKDSSEDLTGRIYRAGAPDTNHGYERSEHHEAQYFTKWDRRLDM